MQRYHSAFILCAGLLLAAPLFPQVPAMRPGQAQAPLPSATLAPDFVSTTVEGKAVRLSDLKGKTVILDYWATWCGPCMSAMPHNQWLAKTFKDQGVVLLAVCTSDKRAAFEAWVKANQAKYPDILFTFDTHERGDPNEDERSSHKLYQVSGLPTQFIINRAGEIKAELIGYSEGESRAEASLAQVGIKVDADTVAKGLAQLQKESDSQARQAAEKTAADPSARPPFYEGLGKIQPGEPLPGVAGRTSTESTAVLADLVRGGPAVVVLWNSDGPGVANLFYLENLAKRYAGQNLRVVGLSLLTDEPAFAKWAEENRGKYSFPVLRDPMGTMPVPAKDYRAMSPEEKKDFEVAMRDKVRGSFLDQTFGAGVPFLPAIVVLDAGGKTLGWAVGVGARSREAMGNLLLRAGLKLDDADKPVRVFTHEETERAPRQAVREPLEVGAVAPDFTTFDLAGREVKLSDYRGKVVLLDFWATWCTPCMQAMPHTQEMAAKYKDQGVVVLGSCTMDARALFEKWVRANQEKYPDIVWSHDPAGRKLARASHSLYGVPGLPTQFVIDRNGKVADMVVGYMEGEVLIEAGLARAGIKVDAAVLEQAKANQARRREMEKSGN
jgi:thiol-disulfide isomerase/thioredoxin